MKVLFYFLSLSCEVNIQFLAVFFFENILVRMLFCFFVVAVFMLCAKKQCLVEAKLFQNYCI